MFKTQTDEIVGKPSMTDHVSYVSCFSLMLVFVGLKWQFLMEILEKTIHYLSDFRESKYLKPIELRCLMETLTG